MNCPECENISLIKREEYIRIFKDEKEIEKIKNEEFGGECMTLEKFKREYIDYLTKNEKGICIPDKNSFKNGKKTIRNLSSISYRLLNFILYSHLFFAKLTTDKKDFDKYLPKGMSWDETLYESWIILKNELLKINISSIEKFMEYIFPNLFQILNKQLEIYEYNQLLNIENNLESEIQNMIKKYKEEEELELKIKGYDQKFFKLLLTKSEEYPFNKYFYYSDYLDEKYVEEKLINLDENKYPVLRKYLELRKKDEGQYLLNFFNLFNNSLNLLNEKYYNKISRENAKQKKLKDEEIYLNNKELFDDFIEIYNNLELTYDDELKSRLILSNNNSLSDFFIDESNNYGKSYIKIYKTFIFQQNKNIENLLDIKIENGIFDITCKNKINVQFINENDLFKINYINKIGFINLLYNNSYKKYNSYNEYVINFDLIEEYMTDILLRNKKLLNETINEFKYYIEDFTYHVSNYMTLFKDKYSIMNLNIYDKIIIYKFYKEIENSNSLHKKMINDFLELIKFLNKDKEIKSDTKINEIIESIGDTSFIFKKLFENQGFTVDKTISIFEYYLKLIYKNINEEIKIYQEKLSNESVVKINNYFCYSNSKNNLICKKDFSYAIRLFISLVLFLEEDKEKQIKSNYNNIINYLYSFDLWKKDIYTDHDFLINLNEFKSFDVRVNQIISLYEILGKDIEDNYFDDVEQRIKDEDEDKLNEFNDNYENEDEGEDEDEDEVNEKLKRNEKNQNVDKPINYSISNFILYGAFINN